MASERFSGGKGNPGNFANDRRRAAEAGRIGGQRQGRHNNPGNFANDRAKAAEAGRKGGQHSHGGSGRPAS
jgi:general stress protein YciG